MLNITPKFYNWLIQIKPRNRVNGVFRDSCSSVLHNMQCTAIAAEATQGRVLATFEKKVAHSTVKPVLKTDQPYVFIFSHQDFQMSRQN